jgi:uncharacterized repeat protein (TIGR01451 family)
MADALQRVSRTGKAVGAVGLVVVLAAAGLGVARGTFSSPGASAALSNGVIQINGVRYSNASPLDTLNIIEPSTAGTDRDAVVLIHGGGFNAGSTASIAPEAQQLAEAGFVAFNIDYRLNGYPYESIDAMAAVAWVRANAATYGVDPSRIGVFGSSSGGTLAAMVGTLGAANGAPVSAAVEWSGSLDEAALVNEDPTGYDHDHVETYVGGCGTAQCPANYTAASPVFLVSPQTSPMLLANSSDETIPLSQPEEMVGALDAAGVPVTFNDLPGQRHATQYDSTEMAPTIAFLTQYLASNPELPAGSPDLSVAQTTTQGTFAAVGQTVNLDYLVTNASTVTLSAVGIQDARAGVGGLECPAPTLAPQASETCTGTYTVSAADVSAGAIVNSATADALLPGTTTPISSYPSTLTLTVLGSSQITVATTATSGSYAAVGQAIEYDYLVTNTGNQTLSSVGVTDTHPGLSPISCPDPSLLPTDSETCTATYEVTQSDVTAGSIASTAVAYGTTPGAAGPTNSFLASLTIPFAGTSSLAVAASAAQRSFSAVGQTINYSFVVTNGGTQTLSGVTVADAQPGLSAVACPDPTLAPQTSETCTATYQVTQGDLAAGSIIGVALASGTLPGGTSPIESYASPVTIPVLASLDLTLTTSPGPTTYSALGQTISYSFGVTNAGTLALSGVGVTDSNGALGSVSCPSSTLAPAASETCTTTGTVTQADLNAGTIANTAIAQGLLPGGTTPITSSPSAVDVPIVGSPALSLVVSIPKGNFSGVGEMIPVTFAVTNLGTLPLSSIGIADTHPGLGAVTCPQPTLAPAASENCTATYTVSQADLTAQVVVMTATAQAFLPGASTPVTSFTYTLTIPLSGSSDITLVLTSMPKTFSSAGQVITYDYKVTDSDTVALSSIGITDNDSGLSAISCPDSTLAPAANEVCTATYTVTQGNVNSGAILHSALAFGTPAGTSTAVDSPISTLSIPLLIAAQISLVKSATQTAYSGVGQTINFNYLVTNTGNVELSSLGIDDTFVGLSPIVCPDVTLAPLAAETCTATYAVTQADMDAGSITNTATAFGSDEESSTPVDSTPSTVIIPVNSVASLSLVKSAAQSSYSAVGQVINYNYLVTNTGNLTLSAVGITDPHAGLSATSCPQPSLDPQASETCTATYSVTQADIDAASITNTATADGTPPGSTTPVDSSASTAVIPFEESDNLTLVKSTTQSSYSTVGQIINYNYLVTNTSDGYISSIGITDHHPGLGLPHCRSTLAPQTSETCTATYTVTQADITAGSITNTATAYGTPTGSTSPVVSAPSTAVIPALLVASLSLVKSTTQSSYSASGQVIDYNYLVTNTGNETLTSIAIVDHHPGLGMPKCHTTLTPGASETCVATYTVTAPDVRAGSITNTATADGTTVGSSVLVVSPPSTAVIPLSG